MLTKQRIFEQMKDSPEHTRWSLYMIQGYNKSVHVKSYKNELSKDTETQNEKLSKSIEVLEKYLNIYPPEIHFEIEFRSSEKASGTGIIGPIEFVNNDNEVRTSQTVNGLGGIPNNTPSPMLDYKALGLVPESILDERLRSMQDRLTLDFEKRLFEREISDERKKLDEERKALREKKDVQDSSLGKVVSAAEMLIGNLINKYIPTSTPLAGNEPEQLSEPEMEIQDIAVWLQEQNLPKEYLVNLKNQVKQTVQNSKVE